VPGKLGDRLAAFTPAAEEEPPRAKPPAPPPGKLGNRLVAFAQPEPAPVRPDPAPRPPVGRLGDRITALAKRQSEDAEPPPEQARVVIEVPGGMSMAQRRAMLDAGGGIGPERQQHEEQDTEIEEVVEARPMAIRSARRPGARRPGALRDIQ
jgi:hypothetical protein